MRWGVLDRLLGEPGSFFETCRLGRPRVFTPPFLPQEVPTLRELTGALGGGLMRTPYVELVRESEVVPAAELGAAAGTAHGAEEGFADPERIMHLLAEGATLLLPRLGRWNASAGALTALLSQDLGRETEAFCFATTVGRRGRDVHCDDADVLVVQLAGRKEWTVYEAPAHGDVRHGAVRTPAAPALCTVIGAGDVLYVPRGAPHRATGEDGLSAHLALTIREAARPAPDPTPGPITEAELLATARELLASARARVETRPHEEPLARTGGSPQSGARGIPADWPAAD
ncbi:cupin domain-containing protein [Streptomyces sp. MBT27]|uniref:JmjC domain-containing protein n=1 Tax=Streptomyces sp. MBT27 TaxID=1488356 RepID=UPI00142271B8|nr:cupin domain-containing protein [Streptomyces sp. MBT27]